MNYRISSKYFLSRLPKLQHTKQQERFGRIICKKQFQNNLHLISFRANRFQCGARTVQRKSLTFLDFEQTPPGFWADVFRQEYQNWFLCYLWYLLEMNLKSFPFQEFLGIFRNNFSAGLTKPLFSCLGALFGNKMFFTEKNTMEFLTFFIKRTTNFEQNRSRSVNKNQLNEHGETIWKKPFWKKTNCLRICCGLRAEFHGRFPEAAFYIFKDTFRVETVDRKKRTCIFVIEIWYKNLRTFSAIFPQGYLYCILVVQRHLLGKNEGKVFLIISIFWVCAEIFRQVVRITFH